MSKFHIKKDGTPGTCNATKGNCPLGGSDSHFDSAEEAQAAAQAKLEKQFGVTQKPSVDLTKTIPIDFATIHTGIAPIPIGIIPMSIGIALIPIGITLIHT